MITRIPSPFWLAIVRSSSISLTIRASKVKNTLKTVRRASFTASAKAVVVASVTPQFQLAAFPAGLICFFATPEDILLDTATIEISVYYSER